MWYLHGYEPSKVGSPLWIRTLDEGFTLRPFSLPVSPSVQCSAEEIRALEGFQFGLCEM